MLTKALAVPTCVLASRYLRARSRTWRIFMGEQVPICISFAWLRHVGECGGHPFVVFSFVVINPQRGHNSSKMFA